MDRESYKKDTVYSKSESQELNGSEIIEAGFFQQFLHAYGYPFKIQTLDSIVGNELRSAGLSNAYSLFFRDSLGSVIEQTGNLASQKFNSAFKTDALLIVDGKRVQAFVVISPPAVYKTMLGLFVSSFLILVFLFYCLIYQTKTIFLQEKLDKLKSDFIHSFIHNIKSPLGTIKTVLLKLVKSELDNRPEVKEKFGKAAMAQIDSLMLQAEKILTIAYLENGSSVVNRAKTDVNVLIAELKEKFSISGNKQILIRTSVSIDGDRDVYLDWSLIRESLSNLIDNAIKYSGDVVEITVDCHTIGNTLQFRVIDNGYGISEKDQLRIYEKFERGAAVKRKEAMGFGLGLNFVKLVAEAHGGIVSLFSHVGEGSEFSITIPLQAGSMTNK